MVKSNTLLATAMKFPRSRRFGAILAVVAVALIVVFARNALLESVGQFVSRADPITPAEWCHVTPESGRGGELEAADLYANGTVRRILVLVPEPSIADQELARRGFVNAPQNVARLVFLGVPERSIATLNVGDGGTNESAQAIAGWFHSHPTVTGLVVTSPTHVRRFRRVLRRAWRADGPLPAVIATRFSRYRPSDWWQSRSTLREGIVELEKLLLDFMLHPLG